MSWPALAPAEKADLDALVALDRTCFDDPWPSALWHAELTRDDRHWLVVRAPDRRRVLVGAGGLVLMPDAAHILRVAVTPAWRGNGLGARLVEALSAATAARGRDAVTLEVRASNDTALRLYRRAGFVSSGRRPGYYFDGEDAVVLWRTVPSRARADGRR